MLAPFLLAAIVSSAPLPAAIGHYASDVTWESADAVLITSDLGVHRYSLRNRTVERLISAAPLPDGVPDPEAVASDGVTVEVISGIAMGGYSMRLADRKRLIAQRIRFVPLDVTVRGARACVLAHETRRKTNEVVFCGKVNEFWSKYTAVHRLTSGEKIFPHALDRLGGAIALDADGSLTVITSAEPGVFRYAPDGKLMEKSGESFDELVITAMREIPARFAGDIAGRYRLLLNTQPIIDDLVLTPRGPAIVVRIAEKGRIRWELWWPRADGRVVPPTRLAMTAIGPYAHLRCDARGSALACVRSSDGAPYLWTFELPK
ncbi:MAG: hypothetical protein ACJ74H_10050 [Thermoanaerobaculia bacterium]